MTTENDSTHHLERDIEDTRSSLAGTLDELADRVSADAWLNDLSTAVQENTADLGQSVRRAANENPGALLAAGAGLALVAFGAAKVLQSAKDKDDDDRGYDRAGYRPAGTFAGSRGATAYADGKDPLSPEFDERLHAADAELKSAQSRQADASADPYSRDAWGTHNDDRAETASDIAASASDLRERASAEAAELYGNARSRADDLKSQLKSGLDDLSDDAKDRIMYARLRVVEAQQKIDAQARKAAGATKTQFQKQPLAFGVGALTIGALAASLLPRSADERRRASEMRDKLLNEAQRVYHDEKQKLTAAASAVVSEGKAQLRDAAKTALDGEIPKPPSGKKVANKIKAAVKDSDPAARKTGADGAPKPAHGDKHPSDQKQVS